MFGLKLIRIAIAAVAAAGVALPVTPAAATKTICVGLIVDARSLGGPVSTDCAKVPDGSTGYDVLKAAGHTVGFRQDGLICTIDNRPAGGCAQTDAQHYWAYFHRAPHSSSWSYSDEGATTYKPDNDATEGWVWRNGDNATPENVPYSTICPQTATTPTPTPSASHIPRSHRTASATPPPAGSPTPTVPGAAHRRHRHAAAHRHTSAPTPTTPTTPTMSSPPVTTAAASTRPHNGSSGPPWGLIAGATAIAVIGGAAAWQWRRREAD